MPQTRSKAKTQSQQLPQLEVGPDRVTNVAGLDTASNRWHMWCDNGMAMKHLCPDRMSADDRRHELFTSALGAFALLPAGTLLVVEEPLALKNGKTTRLLCLAAGAIWVAHLEFSIFWVWADVAQWKKAVIGNGNANKLMIAEWVAENMGLAWADAEDEDFYDAAALCYYGKMALGLV